MTSIAEQLQTALALYEADDYQSASQAYAEVLQQDTSNAEAWHRLGTLMFQAGRLDVAIDCLTKAIRIGGGSSECYYHQGLVYHARNELDQAEATFRQSLHLDANNHRALSNLGTVLLERDHFDDAADMFRRLLVLKPDDTTARTRLGSVLQQQGLYEEALDEFLDVLDANPDCVDTLNKLAALFIAMSQFENAIRVCNSVLDLSPGLIEARRNLTLAQQQFTRESIVQLRADIEENDCDADAWEGLGEALHVTGVPEQAVQAFRRAVQIDPHRQRARSSLVYCSLFSPDVTARRMGELYAEWDRWHAQPLKVERPLLNNDPDPDRRLRLGILSPNPRHHPAARLVVGGLKNLDRYQFETYFYSDLRDVDSATEQFKSTADHWRDVPGMSDSDVVRTIHSDRIDVLILMGGHQAQNRQLVAARKPAPVQIAWTGDPSGQSAVDWLIADRFLIPEEFEEFYTESILRMPHDYATFDPQIGFEVGSCPCASNGYVTFGSFNQAVKHHTGLLELWAGIMKRVPASRLMLIGYANRDNEERLLAPFIATGIEPDRITVKDHVVRHILVESYNRVDVALDTHPFSGGVTTLEALWMGVPVVTMPGETFAGRTSLSHLTNAGLGDLVAGSAQEYTDIAVRLAQNTERLLQLRSNLRNDIRESVLCDGPQFGQDLSVALRKAWRDWTVRQSPEG